MATEPVPADLADFIASDPTDWLVDDTDEAEEARHWYGRHSLNLSCLTSPPWIRWWRSVTDDDTVTVVWHHRPHPEISRAAPDHGRVSMPTGAFVTAVRHLDTEWPAAMRGRIAELERTGPPPGFHIDMDHLRNEQRDRATRLQRRWTSPPTPTGGRC